MAAEGMPFPWRSYGGTISTDLDVIWGILVNALDVIDATEEIVGVHQLIVLGDDNDTLVLEDGSNWTLDPSGVTLDGSSETFDLYVADFGDTTVTLLVDSDLAVQLETAMA